MKRNSLNLLGRGGRDRTDDLMLPKPHTIRNRVNKFNDIAGCYRTVCALFRSFCTKGTHLGCALLIVLLLSCPAHADEWTRADTYREVAYLALHVADWGQTLYISDHPREFHENNPILGSHPSRGEVNTYFIATGLLHPVVSYGLKKYAPPGWSEAWQYVTIGIEVGAVANNLSIGIGFGF